jgi:RNA polymerase-interacting CarD/CdnL/TRCF family regulator
MALGPVVKKILERKLSGIPHVAEVIKAIPVDHQEPALQAAERSYLRSLRQTRLSESESQIWTASIMRRLRRQLGEKELLRQVMSALSEETGEPLPVNRKQDDDQGSATSTDNMN